MSWNYAFSAADLRGRPLGLVFWADGFGGSSTCELLSAARSFLPVFLMLVSTGGGFAGEDRPRAEQLLQAVRPLVIAHRGYSAFAPENTLPAFQLAIAAGADMVELDYHLSSDGTPVVIHDRELDRTTDAVEKWGSNKIRVDTKTAAELAALDAGRWFAPHYAGARLPRLTEALNLIQKDSVTLIERKSGDAASCARLLRERNLINRVVVQSFDWDFLKELHTLVPEQILGALGPPGSRDGRKLTDAEKFLSVDWIMQAMQCGPRVIVWNQQVTRQALDYAHKQGFKVWVYTVNDAAQVGPLLSLGVNGIITDNPSLIWRAVALGNPTAK